MHKHTKCRCVRVGPSLSMCDIESSSVRGFIVRRQWRIVRWGCSCESYASSTISTYTFLIKCSPLCLLDKGEVDRVTHKPVCLHFIQDNYNSAFNLNGIKQKCSRKHLKESGCAYLTSNCRIYWMPMPLNNFKFDSYMYVVQCWLQFHSFFFLNTEMLSRFSDDM